MYDEITNEELISPTVEFKLLYNEEEKIIKENNFIFIYHFCFIDISEISSKLNFGKYVNNF